MGNEYGDMTRLGYNSEVNVSSTQRTKNGFVKLNGFTQPPLKPFKKEKKKVKSQIPYQRSKKIEKRSNTTFKGKAPMNQDRA